MFCPVSVIARPHHQYPWTPSMVFIRSRCHSGVAMGCACCAMHKSPQPSEGPPAIRGTPVIWGALSNLKGSWGPHQSEGPSNLRRSGNPRGSSNLRGSQQSEGLPTIWGILSTWEGPNNLRRSQQSETPQKSEGPHQSKEPQQPEAPQQSEVPQNPEGPQPSEGLSAIWKAPDNLRALSTWGAPTIWGALNKLKGPGNLMAPGNWQSDPWELLSFRSSFRPMLSTRSAIFEIAQLLVDYYALSSAFSEVCTAHMLSVTLPVTVATFERSFSKLKLIKNFTNYHV